MRQAFKAGLRVNLFVATAMAVGVGAQSEANRDFGARESRSSLPR
jgi:hypothetical protein